MQKPEAMDVVVKRGALIIFEGLDHSGKSTQCTRLFERLKLENYNVKHLRFPDRTTASGIMLDQFLKGRLPLGDKEVHELFSVNRWECHKQMLTDLRAGVSLIVDRYAFSGVAFTSAKGYPLDECKKSDIGLIGPDVVFFLNLSVEDAAKRGNFGTEIYENVAFQTKVREIYAQLQDPTWKVINAARSVEEIHEELTVLAKQIITTAQEQQLKKLWKK